MRFDIFYLFVLLLATLSSWEICRRLLPFRVPVVVAEIVTVGIALILIKWADQDILLSLSVPGGLMLLATVISTEPHTPWGPRVAEILKVARQRRHQTMREARP